MKLIGFEYLNSQLSQPGFTAKVVFNRGGIIFFPATQQHRDQKMPGISYEDDSAGNALAAMLSAGKIEIRNHRDFSEPLVAQIVLMLMALPELAILQGWQITYGGRNLAGSSKPM
jgi:hypothetical protein